MLHIRWELIVAGLIGYAAVSICFHFAVNVALDKLFAQEAHIEDPVTWLKYTRQDAAGILIALKTTNALLGAIIMVLACR